jgi:hypothetical protein
LRRATSTASSEMSQPMTRAAPNRADTKDSTPLPHPTSMTVSVGSISSASAIVRLVWEGANTPGFTSIVNGPVRPFHTSSLFGSFVCVSFMACGSSCAGSSPPVNRRSAYTRGA